MSVLTPADWLWNTNNFDVQNRSELLCFLVPVSNFEKWAQNFANDTNFLTRALKSSMAIVSRDLSEITRRKGEKNGSACSGNVIMAVQSKAGRNSIKLMTSFVMKATGRKGRRNSFAEIKADEAGICSG